MSKEVDFSITEQDANDIAVSLLSMRIMKAIEGIVGVKKKDIAEKLGVSPSYVSQLFNGDKILNLQNIHQIQKSYKLEAGISFREIKNMYIEYTTYETKSAEISKGFVEASVPMKQMVQA